MIDKELVRIGYIKFFEDNRYGFIVDFLDNSEYYFKKSYLIAGKLSDKNFLLYWKPSLDLNQLSDTVVSYKIRKSEFYQDKYEAYDIAPPFHYKKEILDKFDNYPPEIQNIIYLFLPSIIYKEKENYYEIIKELIDKYELLVVELHDYVKNFDIEEFLKSYMVKTEFYYSASTKDWDTNSLFYKNYIIEPYSNLESIYKRCDNYEETLVFNYYETKYCFARVFDLYIDDISQRYQEIKTTTAYGRDRDFWNDLDPEEIKSRIPELTAKWKDEIRQTYNKKSHFTKLLQPLESRFSSIIQEIPTFVNLINEEKTQIDTPHFTVDIHYPNGCIKFNTTESGEHFFGYKARRQFNEQRALIVKTDVRISDIDYINFKKHTINMLTKAKEMFQDMLLKHQDF